MKYLMSAIFASVLLFASSVAQAVPCPTLTVVFADNLAVDYTVDHDNCVFFWDASNHNFDYNEVLEQVAEYNSYQTTAVAVGGYWCKWLLDIQETEGYFTNAIYLRCKGHAT